MPNIDHHPTIKHRARTGRFLQAKNQQALKNQVDLERAIIKSTSNAPCSFSSTPHLNKSALVTGLLATMALSAVVMPCVQSAPVQDKPNKEPELEFAPDPLPPEAIKGGVSIKGTPQSSCLVSVSSPSLFVGRSCTGTVIASDVVLTAQHCIFNLKPNSPFNLVDIPDAGNFRVHKIDGDRWNVAISEVGGHKIKAIYPSNGFFVNDRYTYNTPSRSGVDYKNDLVVLKLKTPIHCSPYYKLPTEEIIANSIAQCQSKNKVSNNFIIRGYGVVNWGDNDYLAREAHVKCASWKAPPNGLSTGGAYFLSNDKKESTGSGDSGGPVTFYTSKKEYQVGVCYGSFSDKPVSVYTSLRGRTDIIKEIIEKGDTTKALKIGCVKLYSHFSPFWESSQRITLTNTCQQTEKVILAMGEFGKGDVMAETSEDLEHNRDEIILRPSQSLSYAIPKNKRPVFPLSRSIADK